MASQGRIVKELSEVGKDDKHSGIKAVPVTPGELRHLKGTIPGPQGTPYEGGVFEIDIVLPKQYPFEPPKMKYLTKIWHPNISSQTGAICLVSLFWRLLAAVFVSGNGCNMIIIKESRLGLSLLHPGTKLTKVRCSKNIFRIFWKTSGVRLWRSKRPCFRCKPSCARQNQVIRKMLK